MQTAPGFEHPQRVVQQEVPAIVQPSLGFEETEKEAPGHAEECEFAALGSRERRRERFREGMHTPFEGAVEPQRQGIALQDLGEAHMPELRVVTRGRSRSRSRSRS